MILAFLSSVILVLQKLLKRLWAAQKSVHTSTEFMRLIRLTASIKRAIMPPKSTAITVYNVVFGETGASAAYVLSTVFTEPASTVSIIILHSAKTPLLLKRLIIGLTTVDEQSTKNNKHKTR